MTLGHVPKQPIGIRLHPRDMARVEDLAVREGRTRNNAIQMLVREALDAREGMGNEHKNQRAR
jgi:hypothetical protein